MHRFIYSGICLLMTPFQAALAAAPQDDRAHGHAAKAVETHPFNVRDLVTMRRVSDPKASPDGRSIVFSVRETDLDGNKGRTQLWLMDADGANIRQITSHAASSSSPEWSPAGDAIFFLSARGDSTQVWRLPLSGGEAVAVTALPLDVNAFRVSPDGRQLCVAMEVFPDTSDPADTCKRTDEKSKSKASGRVYDSLLFRHWDTWKDGKRSHLFVVPVATDAESAKAAKPVALMKGMDADCPGKPFGGAEDFTWTPDSRGIVFAARNVGREEAWRTDFDLFLVPADGSAAPRNLTPENEALLAQPTFSPDGRMLAFLAMARPGYESDRQRIALFPWPAGPMRMLTEKWDRSASAIAWSRDGKTIFTHADDLGQHALFAVDADTGEARRLVAQGHVGGVTVANDRLVYALDSLAAPADLYAIPAAGGSPRRLTAMNHDAMGRIRFGQAEQFTFAGWNGEEVHGYLVKPVDFDASKKYPVAFLIHGGPQGSFGNHFHYRWNPQTYAGAGYAAVMIDFHGSTGYGQAFTDAINGHWGDRPFEDLQKGLAAALEKYPFLDGDRVAALGASFGGYMINWIAGNWPDRFRCLVNHDGNLDERFAYFDTEELWFPEWEHGGTPWEKPEGYLKFNPIDHVAKWQTPMLVIHGGQDFRVVDTQGMATFTALQRKGIPSRFLHFPDENHWVLKPANSIQWHETVLSWLDQWCKPGNS
jgi:dipeptidyl aminopeptidase/acylaminoacyl peptidase